MRYVNNDAEELQRNKYRYCVHKDEFAVGIGRPWYVLISCIISLLFSDPVPGLQECTGSPEAHDQQRVPQDH